MYYSVASGRGVGLNFKMSKANVYLTTIVSPYPRQIAGFDIVYDKTPERIQQEVFVRTKNMHAARIVDNSPPDEACAADGFLGYVDVVCPGKHIRNLLLHQLNLTTSLRSFCRNSSSAPPYAPLGARRRRFLDLRQKSLQICWQVLIGGAIEAYETKRNRFRKE